MNYRYDFLQDGKVVARLESDADLENSWILPAIGQLFDATIVEISKCGNFVKGTYL